MNMNILEQEDLIKGATDDLLLQEAQSPTGSVPQFLVVSEIQRRKSMRDRFSAQEQQPKQSVAEQIVAGAASQMPPQGIGALQPQMPSQVPSMPMQAPQMPPEMMAAQNAPMTPSPQMMAAGGGRMPYRRMAGGGMVPPNSLVEDASKFNPQTLYDMDASQMAMASPTNMGIASVLPMAGGGIVRMANIGSVPYQQRGLRNNNPMNIKYNPENDWEGQTGVDDDGFVIFDTADSGMRAGNIILGTYGSKHNIDTLSGIVNRFAPDEDNNDTKSYMNFVSNQTGIGVDDKINLGNPSIRKTIAKSMAALETPDYNPSSNNQENEPGISSLDPNSSRYSFFNPKRNKRILQREERDKIRKQRQDEIINSVGGNINNFYNNLNFGERPESFKKRMGLGNKSKESTGRAKSLASDANRSFDDINSFFSGIGSFAKKQLDTSEKNAIEALKRQNALIDAYKNKSNNEGVVTDDKGVVTDDKGVVTDDKGVVTDEAFKNLNLRPNGQDNNGSSEEFNYGDILEFIKGTQGDSEQNQKERMGLALAQFGAGIARGKPAEGLKEAAESAVLGSRADRKESVANMINAAQVIRFDDLRKERGLKEAQLILNTAASLYKESIGSMIISKDQQNVLFNQIISQVTNAIDSGNFSGLGGVGVDPSFFSSETASPEAKTSQFTVEEFTK